MGAAIEIFSSSRALLVPRTRFAPVKTTDDLLLLRSDAYRIGGEFVIEPAAPPPARPPFVELDRRFYGLLDEFERRFPSGPPSLIDAERFVVQGDVTFGAGVVVRGSVEVTSPDPVRIGPGTVLES
jgi:UTP--glucose-1-phosphate uridylyltransferase